jgi:mono/diheme cytochrome c family protein
MADVPLAAVLSQGLLVTVLTQTQFGQIWLFRLVLLAMLGCCLLARHRRRNAVSGPVDWIALAVAAALLATLALVGHGAATPGMPGWPPLFFWINPTELAERAEITLAALALLFGLCLAAGVILTVAGDYRPALTPLVGLVLSLALAWLPLWVAIEPAYPTSYCAAAEPYWAPSVPRGRPLYAENCALCHGAGGSGDGPAAAGLVIRPADLTAAHLLAHPPGDLFWWIGHVRGNGAMPGFAATISADRRWDLINFLRARAAGVQSQHLGPTTATAAAAPVPDIAFERSDRQQTLAALLRQGPVLLILFSPPAPAARLAQLAAARPRLAAAGLAVVAVDLGGPPAAAATALPFVAGVAPDVASTLRLFAPAGRAQASELMLDRAGNARSRWASDGPCGLADPETLATAAESVARIPAAAPSHAGHAH